MRCEDALVKDVRGWLYEFGEVEVGRRKTRESGYKRYGITPVD